MQMSVALENSPGQWGDNSGNAVAAGLAQGHLLCQGRDQDRLRLGQASRTVKGA